MTCIRTPRARYASIVVGWAALLVSGISCRSDITEPSRSAPAFSAAASTPLAFRQISAGGFHTCGVTAEDDAYCWGGNFSSQLGDGTSVDRTTPVRVLGGLKFRVVSAGEYTTCGLTTDGKAYCWGNNGTGMVGDGTTTLRATPMAVLGGLRFRRIDTGEGHTCGLREPDLKAYCWGYNRFGQLGDGTTIDRLTPVAVAGGRAFRQLAASGTHTCAVTPTLQAYCWGQNNFGQLGLGTTVLRRVRPALVAGGHAFAQIDVARTYSCAVTSDDRAFCWGSNQIGQLGDGTMSDRYSPRAVSGGISFTRVTTGGGHACGGTNLNQSYCWGGNLDGQLGDGTGISRLVPTAVAGGLVFAQTTAANGGVHTCGRTKANVVYCWGYNGRGELGDGTFTSRFSPVPITGAP